MSSSRGEPMEVLVIDGAEPLDVNLPYTDKRKGTAATLPRRRRLDRNRDFREMKRLGETVSLNPNR